MEDKIIELVNRNLSTHKIAKELGVGQSTVRRWLEKIGLKTHVKYKNSLYENCKFCLKALHKGAEQYCNNKCQADFRWKNTKLKIEENQCVENSRQGRRYIIETKGYQCQICNIKKWQDVKMPLILDHIDGNSDNWLLDNLRLLCSNCDSIQPTYKSKNMGKGRFSRRKRYQEGKSY